MADAPGRDSLPRRPRAALFGDVRGRLSVAALVVLAVVALLAPLIAPYPPAEQLDVVALKLRPPSATHPFGTDPFSRDVLSRMLHGAGLSLRVGVLAAVLSGVLGLGWGAVAGYFGRGLDLLMMRGVDALLSVPRVLLVLTVIALWGAPTASGLVLVLGLTGWFGPSRLARAEALAVRSREYVSASLALGASHGSILVRHVLAQAAGPVLVAATVAVGQVIVLEAGLAFLGHGIPQPTPSWGNIIADGRDTLGITWWLTLFPGLALIVTALAVNGVAVRLRTALSPRQLPAA